jgi:FkbM family methyltransferase
MGDGRLPNDMSSDSSQLENLLGKDPDELVETVRKRVRPKLERKKGLILFGTGELGRTTLENLQGIGELPLAFADNNPSLAGTKINGVPVMSPANAAAKFPDSLFVIAVYTNEPVRRQLREMGVEFVTFAELAWSYPEAFLPRVALELPHKIFSEARDVRAGLSLWADEISRKEYLGQLAWRSTLDPAVLPAHAPANETYFAPDLFDLAPDEVFVDCGAFDGETASAFLQRCQHSFGRIIALEPDSENRIRFEKWRANLPPAEARKIELQPVAADERRELVSLVSTGTVMSSLQTDLGDIECAPLDDILAETAPTFIKMDIEGSEPAALRGASGILQEHQPILAICLYHAQEHLWEIPHLIRSLNPAYRLFLRRYSDECWELVCYAVPVHRCKI